MKYKVGDKLHIEVEVVKEQDSDNGPLMTISVPKTNGNFQRIYLCENNPGIVKYIPAPTKPLQSGDSIENVNKQSRDDLTRIVIGTHEGHLWYKLTCHDGSVGYFACRASAYQRRSR